MPNGGRGAGGRSAKLMGEATPETIHSVFSWWFNTVVVNSGYVDYIGDDTGIFMDIPFGSLW